MSFYNLGRRPILTGGLTMHPSATTGRIDLSRSTPLPANTDGGVIKAGTSSARVTSSTPSMKFLSFYWDNTATSGSAQGLYNRLYVSGAGADGDALRAFATVNDVTAATVRGAHISLSHASSGKVTGLGCALETTLHISALGSQSGTLYSIKAAIHSDAATSDPAGAALAYFGAINQGDATGGADVDDDVALIHIDGHTIGNGNLIEAVGTAYALSEFTHSIRIKIGSTLYYIPISNLAGSAT